MIRRLLRSLPAVLLLLAPRPARGQEDVAGGRPDSVTVVGARRVSRETILQAAGLLPGHLTTYRDIQRAIRSLYTTGQFDDVRVDQDTTGGRQTLIIAVRERPILIRWAVRGVNRLSEHSVRSKVALNEGRPIDPAAVARSAARIDSLYQGRGYYRAEVKALSVFEGADSSRVRIVFDVTEGRRVAIARIDVQGNTHFPDADIVAHMATRPEGFWWWRKGAYDDEKLLADRHERLPKFYGEHGYADFQVLDDTLLVNDSTGKAELVLRVSEGEPYHVGTFEIVGSRRFSVDELQQLYPFQRGERTGLLGLGGIREGAQVFDQAKWEDATSGLYTLYHNEGYIYTQVRPDVLRRIDASGQPVVDLRWVINEGLPAIVNKVEIVGNDVTHERVIRDQIVILPGDVFRQDALLRSYQNIQNLGFFNQLPLPETPQANEQGDIDVIFHVSEKHTGNVNFGASLGQGTGLGGFVGLEEPNLFGQGKKGRFQWQFGKNINDFDLSFTDPAIRESRISGTIGVHNTRLRYNISDLGQIRRRGANLQFGFPWFRDRYTRLFLSYGIDEQSYTGSASNTAFNTVFNCNNCIRSTIGVSVLRDTRIDLPFATAGTMTTIGVSQSGGILGGTADFQRMDLEGHWHAPLGRFGSRTSPIKTTLGLSTRAGFLFGNSPFFDQLFSMGGTQYGIPLRGYDEFSITPHGFNPLASTTAISASAFGKSFFLITGEIGARVSQMLYLNLFYNAGNVWTRAVDFNPTRLFRGAGIGVDVVSPLGPLGLDWAYGFDKVDVLGRPAPGWKLHFKLGTLF